MRKEFYGILPLALTSCLASQATAQEKQTQRPIRLQPCVHVCHHFPRCFMREMMRIYSHPAAYIISRPCVIDNEKLKTQCIFVKVLQNIRGICHK